MSEPEYVVHPLFPLAEDEEDPDAVPPDVQEITVQRKENGRMVTAPRSFYPNELTSLAMLHAEYGGGEYHLVARNHLKRITARKLYTLPGPPKPMFDDGVPQTAPGTKPQASNPMGAMLGAAMGQSGEGSIMALIMMMMQQMMQANAAAQTQQTQMFIAMMQGNQSASAADKQAQQEAYNRQREQDRQHQESMMLMMKELAQARSSSGGSDEAFFKGVEFMRNFSQTQIEMAKASAKGGESDLESLLGSLGEAISGGLQLYQLSKEGVPAGAIPGAPTAPVQ